MYINWNLMWYSAWWTHGHLHPNLELCTITCSLYGAALSHVLTYRQVCVAHPAPPFSATLV